MPSYAIGLVELELAKIVLDERVKPSCGWTANSFSAPGLLLNLIVMPSLLCE